MNSDQRIHLTNSIALSEMHWAVLDKNYELLENLLSQCNPRKLDKTSDWLFTKQKQRDSRVFVAGDFLFPPDRVENFPFDLNFDKGSSPLHFAAAIGDTTAITLFIKSKTNINVKDDVGATPLHLACLYGHLETAKILLNSKTKIDEGTKTRKSLVFYDTGSTVLHAALTSGNKELVQWLIDNDADIEVKTKFGCDSYFFAGRGANPEVIQLLAKLDLEFPKVGIYYNFPLLEAVKQNSYETVVEMLTLSSPVKEPQGNQAPLNEAVKNNFLDIREILIKHGAERPAYAGNLSQAASNNDTSFIREYHQAKNDLNKIFDRTTGLMMAAAHGRIEAVKLLVSLGADVNINSDGTALHSALANKWYDIALILLDNNIECSSVDGYGNSVLFNALSDKVPNRINTCKRMIKLGANPHSVSKHGVSAYSLAERSNDLEMIALFDSVSSEGAIDLRYTAPTSSKVLTNLADNYEWNTVYQELWDELVPPSGNANSLQGELLRSIGKLSDEFNRNGNINWDHNKALYMDMISFLDTHLFDGSITVDEKELKTALKKLTHFNVVYYDKIDSPHRQIAESLVAWCAAHKTLINYH
jgi:ankyrin repeat protein